MRKTAFVRPLSICIYLFCLVALGLICLPAFAQDATPIAKPAQKTPAALPSDPKELMILAAKSNSLTRSDVLPWHLKASLTMFNESGNTIDQGTYEELWVSQKKFKIEYKSTAFTQIEYGSEKGVLFTGASASPPSLFGRAGNEFVNPIMESEETMERWVLGREKRDQDGMKLVCLEVKGSNTTSGFRPFIGPNYCLDAETAILRSSTSPADLTLFTRSNTQSFQGHYLPGEINAVHKGTTVLKAHLDSIDAITTIDDALFLPPPDAAPVIQKTINISPGVSQGMLLNKIAPEYPVSAKARGIQGVVFLQAIISKDGHIVNLHVVSGPSMLQQAAMDAVKQWVYRPYLLNGEPVAVMTTINVIFALGNSSPGNIPRGGWN
jgi:TonB family protein